MQYIVTYAAGLYSWLSKISCELRICNFRYLSSGHSYISWGMIWGSVVIFRSLKGYANKEVWETQWT